MPRYTVRQAAAAKPLRVALAAVPTAWTTILEAPDFSVSDTNRLYQSDRDPADIERRIQPGTVEIDAPLMFYNSTGSDRWAEVRILTEAGAEVIQGRIVIAAGDTWLHPAAGQRLLKLTPASANGDRLQVRAEVGEGISLTCAASEGAASQHEPERVAL